MSGECPVTNLARYCFVSTGNVKFSNQRVAFKAGFAVLVSDFAIGLFSNRTRSIIAVITKSSGEKFLAHQCTHQYHCDQGQDDPVDMCFG